VPAPTRPTAEAADLKTRTVEPPALLRYLPSGRSLLAGLAIGLIALAAYVGARETSVFAVHTLDVRGGTAKTRAHVRTALAGDVGVSLLKIDRAQVAGKLADVPDVLSFEYDRVFPNTLRVVVRREHPVLVLRQSNHAFLVSATGRVLKSLPHPLLSHLPRLWLTAAVPVAVGDDLPATDAAAAHALAAANRAHLPGGVRTITFERGSFALELGAGLELRLGPPKDVLLKLAIANRILRETGAAVDPGYLDVSVPERPVLSTNAQVAG
jgi:cell division septal protein FtsQ